jgi:hypothetical protein
MSLERSKAQKGVQKGVRFIFAKQKRKKVSGLFLQSKNKPDTFLRTVPRA